MKHLFIRFQLVLVSVLLLITFAMGMFIAGRFNRRWDFTKDKIYSLKSQTIGVLEKLKGENIEAFAFYPHDDPARDNLEVFLKECKLRHRNFKYSFYDPDRFPSLAKRFNVTQFYTVVLQMNGRTERVAEPNEETFTNALLRLVNPVKFSLCFTTGHNEAPLNGVDRNSLSLFKQGVENSNYTVQEIILQRDKIPDFCSAVVVAGPHNEFSQEDWNALKAGFNAGTGILFLIDPMDPGAGKTFRDFMKIFGIDLGENVVIDKMSRVVGGDFLVPLVAQYVTEHPVTNNFNQTTFFPVSRSVQPSTEPAPGIEVVPLALSGSGSWAETDLAQLEKGQAAFDSAADLAGPICLAVGAEQQGEKGGRMVVVGDSDFLTDAYSQLSGNMNLGMNMLRWLVRDDRFIALPPRQLDFQPLFLTTPQRSQMLLGIIVALPLVFLAIGVIIIARRKRTA